VSDVPILITTFHCKTSASPLDLHSCRFQYSAPDEKKANAIQYSGRLGSYAPGGFIRELREVSFKSVHRDIDELYANHWIDHATRAVFIELTVYNVHLHVFCAIKYVLTGDKAIVDSRLCPSGGAKLTMSSSGLYF